MKIHIQNTILIVGTIVTAMAIGAARIASTESWAVFFDNLHWTLSSATATLVIAISWIKQQGPRKVLLGWFFAGFLAMFIGQCIYDAQVILGTVLIPDHSTPFFLLQAPLIAIGLLTLLKKRSELVTVLLDASAFGLLLLALVLTVYMPMIDEVSTTIFITLVAYPIEFFILAVLGFVAALERNENINLALLAQGLSPFVLGTLWTVWNANVLIGNIPVASLLGDGFSVFYLVWAAGIINKKPRQALPTRISSSYKQTMEMLPIGLVIACAISLVLTVPAIASVHDNVIICIIGALAISILRQSMLLRDRERLIRENEAAKIFHDKLLERQRLEILGTITSGIAHDIRNVLTVISGSTEMIPLCESQEEADSLLENVSAASFRGQEIMQRILRFAKSESNDYEPFAVSLLLEEIQRMLKTALPKNHEIDIDIEPDLPHLKANSSQIYQILMNLAINASHAIGDKSGKIIFNVRKAQTESNADTTSYIEFLVKDSGSGMNEETLHRVFEPFFSTKPDSLGTGLGLSIVRDIVTEHKGTVAIDSIVGEGTTVIIRFPL